MKVFGARMATYAIGHELALVRQGNPIATYNESSFQELSHEAKKLALTMAVEVCGKIGIVQKARFILNVFLAKPEALENEINKFRVYRSEGSLDLPLTKMPKDRGLPYRYFGSPSMASLINYLTANHSLLIQSHFKGSPLNFPLGLAQILYTTHLETTGGVWVKNKQEMERDEPPKGGTPPAGQNEKVLTGEEAEKAFAEAVANANKGK